MNERQYRYLICFGFDEDMKSFETISGTNCRDAIYNALVYWAGDQETFVENSICNAVCVEDAIKLFNIFSDSTIRFIVKLDEENTIYEQQICFTC